MQRLIWKEVGPLVQSVHTDVYSRFDYVEDAQGLIKIDKWGPCKIVGDRLQGDCDNFAIEVANRLRDAGVPDDAMALGECSLKGGRNPDHMYLIIATDEGLMVSECNSTQVNPGSFYAGWGALAHMPFGGDIRAAWVTFKGWV